MKFDDYACVRFSHDPTDPSIENLVDERAKEMYEDWNLAAYSRSRLVDELEDSARMRFLIAITAEFMGIMISKGVDSSKLWQVYAKFVQKELNLYMSDLA